MNKTKIAEAMGEIDDRYILEADAALAGAKHLTFPRAARWAVGIAAALAISVLVPNVSSQAAQTLGNLPVVGAYFRLVTFRDWDYEDDSHSASVHVQNLEADGADSESSAAAAVSAINLDMNAITDRLTAEFKESVKEDGYTALSISTDVVTDSARYYAVKLSTFVSEADGYEESHYYTIDKTTGEEVTLASLFAGKDDSYLTTISDEIKKQMRENHEADSSKTYWLDDPLLGDENFTSITDKTQFYINADGRLVIVFAEGEVAPMSMGEQQFVMPASIWQQA
ncbi:MAG: RsiV family protein, partial [Lachnospiraceae bacterium]